MKRFIPVLIVPLAFACATLTYAAAATQPESGPDAAGAKAAAAAEASESGAVAPIETLHQTLIEVMKNADALGYDGRLARLEPIMDTAFDLPFMAEKSAGRYWKDFADDQRRRWVEAFRDMTMANYAGNFDDYSGQRFVTLGTEPAGFDTVLVKTKLLQPDKSADDDVEINYRLHDTAGGWKIVDIYLSGTVSELALRRAEYGSVLQRDGFDKLVTDLASKIAALRAGKVTTD